MKKQKPPTKLGSKRDTSKAGIRRRGKLERPRFYIYGANGRFYGTESQVAKAFTEWDRRYRANPEGFMSEAQRLLFDNPESYGPACARYFLEIVLEQWRQDHP